MPASARSALVLTVDGLHSGFLGPYGNTWIQTPEFDALAAEGFVFDQAMIAHPRLDKVFDAVWSVRETSAPAGQGAVSLAQVLADAGIATALVTDDASIAGHPLATGFAECVLLPPVAPGAAARDIEETGLAQAFAAAADRLAALRSPFLLWLHVRGMTAPWDAPSELRRQYADPEDPPTPNFVAVPDRRLPEDYDPDELLGIVHAFAGQVSLLDICLGVLRGALGDSPAAASALFCVMGARSFPLGEHGLVGGQQAPLYSELLQIPWLLRFPDGYGALDRSSALVQQQDLPATLLAWWQLDAAGAMPGSHDLLPLVQDDRLAVRDRVVVTSGPNERVLRTPAWYLRATGPTDSPRRELFTKPSDRWDVNQVADRAPDIAEEMAAALAACQAAGPDAQLPPLDSKLLEPVD
jgi:arylsulfatase A-like enzyme